MKMRITIGPAKGTNMMSDSHPENPPSCRRLTCTESEGTNKTADRTTSPNVLSGSPVDHTITIWTTNPTMTQNSCHHQYSARDARVPNLRVCDSTDDTAARNGTTGR